MEGGRKGEVERRREEGKGVLGDQKLATKWPVRTSRLVDLLLNYDTTELPKSTLCCEKRVIYYLFSMVS